VKEKFESAKKVDLLKRVTVRAKEARRASTSSKKDEERENLDLEGQL
jgi:hypothetical protein